MKKVTDLSRTEIMRVIDTANKIYDSIEEFQGNYELWHDIASGEAYVYFGVTDEGYDADYIDDICNELDRDDYYEPEIPFERDMDQYYR